jgi:hypothetical protein
MGVARSGDLAQLLGSGNRRPAGKAGNLDSAALSSDRHAELQNGPARRLTECDGHTARTFSGALAYP